MCRKMETTRPEANNNNGSNNRESESKSDIIASYESTIGKSNSIV